MTRPWTQVALAVLCTLLGFSILSVAPIGNAEPTDPPATQAEPAPNPEVVPPPETTAPSAPSSSSPSANQSTSANQSNSQAQTNDNEIVSGAEVARGSVSMAEMRKKLDALEETQRELAARRSESTEKLTAAQNQLNTTRTQIVSQRDDMAHLEAQLIQIALQQYQDRGLNSTAVIMTSNSTDDFLSYLTAMYQVTDTANTLFAALQLEQGTLAELERSEKAAVDTIEREQQEIAALESESRKQIAETSRLLGNMSGMAGVRAGSSGVNVIGTGVSDPWKTVPNPSKSLVAPMETFTVSSPYGMRYHPVTGIWTFHDGYDMSSRCGSPVVSPANGYVIDYYWAGSYGNRLVIDHGIVNGRHVVSSHNHLSGGVAGPGLSVVQGQVVALIGSTGTSTGCHNHYMLWIDGEIVDPDPYV
ncbi:MAG: peptidoglycan DD-metalloendopeptidase family protein [Propionibacteriaceae bacterium]|nr:peptidoglycan DD-metalloendopeptidase family protein [Propionibacteriaceae bacterium]